LPNLYPNLVEHVNYTISESNEKIITVKFAAILGDVNEINETSGFYHVNNVEVFKGVPNGQGIQLVIEETISPILNVNDSESNVKNIFVKATFRIFFFLNCKLSIRSKQHLPKHFLLDVQLQLLLKTLMSLKFMITRIVAQMKVQ
jgi:hypothetical protein